MQGARPSTPANQEEANRRKMIVTVGGIAMRRNHWAWLWSLRNRQLQVQRS